MNMMAVYSDCYFHNTFPYLDYTMHFVLKEKTSKKWLEKFNAGNAFKKIYELSVAEIEKSIKLKAIKHQAIVKWFVFGLNGPFGAVNGINTQCYAMFGNVNTPTKSATLGSSCYIMPHQKVMHQFKVTSTIVE